MKSKNEILIIGGGASGMFAALAASERGARVTIAEKMDRPGRKLSITGKGRCNLTTGCSVDEAVSEFGANGKFLRGAFSRFFSTETISIFESLGIEVAMERGRRVFPLSMRADEVAGRIAAKLDSMGVKTIPRCRVYTIKTADGKAVGAETSSGNLFAHSVIFATGGASYPRTGSTGDGYAIAAKLGHTVIPPLPALVPIELLGKDHIQMNSLTLKNVNLALFLDGKKLTEEFGESTFTSYGITGPAALPLGKHVASKISLGRLSLLIDFKPALTKEQLDARIRHDLTEAGGGAASGILPGLLPSAAIPLFSKKWGAASGKQASTITSEERLALVSILKGLAFTVKGTRPIEEALVTAGGVSLREINPKTMESKLVKGLYICGELLDIDAGTGGFNLQAAFSTGYIAGVSAAQEAQS